MYKSPIEILYGQMRMQVENDVVKAVQDVGVNVDRNELILALEYDRGQYEKGYADGKADAIADLVRCKDCRHNIEETEQYVICNVFDGFMGKDDFCSDGERKDK